MLRIDRASNSLARLPSRKLAEVGLLERTHLQQMIRRSADAFFSELEETLLLIGEEVQPTDFVADRIDLLATDAEGTIVVIELKRDSDKLQLLQAIPYAGMLSKWTDDDIREQYREFCNRYPGEPHTDLDEFLGPNVVLNQQQRVVLVAEDFEYEVLIACEWLTETYGVDLRCYRLALARDDESEYLTCTRVSPPREITEQALKRGRGTGSPLWQTWDDYLKDTVKNDAIVEFVNKELPKRSSYLGKDPNLRFLVGDKIRFQFYPGREYAYVWQLGRFDNDVQLWKTRLKNDPQVNSVAHERNLRFLLRSQEDLTMFVDIVDKELRPEQFQTFGGEAVPTTVG
ncbi:MAG: hypothetical protein ACRD19_15955 [Terriglobia bacterium]